MIEKKIVVISAINIHEGGMLTILQDCLLNLSEYDKNIRIIAIVHNKAFVPGKGIYKIELAKSRGSWLRRLYYEYFYFKKLSRRIKPFLWISLHDISPNVEATRRAVYCHNPSSFYNVSPSQIKLDPKFLVYNILYDFLYKKNIKKNDFVIVQQSWIRDRFNKMFSVDINKIIVATPTISMASSFNFEQSSSQLITTFFYPSFPRIFKNFETLMEASKILNKKTNKEYNVIVTISGNENNYSKWLQKKFNNDPHIKFVGVQKKSEVEKMYQQCSCVVFPSELETWGLPITEGKSYNKPLLLADLPYAHETVGEYNKASFFEPRNAEQLSNLMLGIIDNTIQFKNTISISLSPPYTKTWNELFSVLLS